MPGPIIPVSVITALSDPSKMCQCPATSPPSAATTCPKCQLPKAAVARASALA
ncbi:uncharacterized protein BDZ83DRAFT_641321 [Colletotrichum acutatum]|uniref:Uncharacterized protein n=1 Tax=Glomerella acutata TaxID=27357 RepID=A0AAD8X919_GLOAC|nr:uncharacterized protein BDZ83DRAFT_641321 [Colletotrichum acutatum]KAK1709463.1 hypothetical protein BDZ83DRAFT_641321 [Colletotrichum acutatum]